MSTQTEQPARQFNTNLKTIGAGQNQGPFRITHVGAYNGRTIFNFGFKTVKTPEGKNATYSVPSDWGVAGKFVKGDLVTVDIGDDGYIKNIWAAKVQAPNVLEVHKSIDATLDDQASELDKQEADKDAAIAATAGTDDELPF